MNIERSVALLPETITELCFIRLGLQPKGFRSLPFAARLRKAIDRAAADAIADGAGLLHSEAFAINWRHFGVLQYWRSFEELEAWSHRPPHSDWWRDALARMRTRRDFGIYHETFLVPRDRIESIYLNCTPAGLASFGTLREPVGPLATSKARLGRLREPTA
jgi:hypothetical protein